MCIAIVIAHPTELHIKVTSNIGIICLHLGTTSIF